MTGALFSKAAEGLLGALIDSDTDDIRIMALSSGAGKAITGASNATPISITCTSHGYTTGDRVMIKGVGGNTASNGLFTITNTGANTFTLQDATTGANVAGNGAYTSGGFVLNMTVNDFKDDVAAAIVATTSTIASPTITNGVFDHADITFSAVTGSNIEWFVWYKHTGVNSTSRLYFAVDSWSTASNPIVPNGGDIVLQLNASGILKLSA